MNRLFCTLLFLVTSSMLFATSLGRINDNNVRLRQAPSLDSSILKVMSKDTEVEIVGYDRNIYKKGARYYLWVNVAIGNNKGWVYSEFLDTDYFFRIDGDDVMLDALDRTAFSSQQMLFVSRDKTNVSDSTGTVLLRLRQGEELFMQNDTYSPLVGVKSQKLIVLTNLNYEGRECYINLEDSTLVFSSSKNTKVYLSVRYDLDVFDQEKYHFRDRYLVLRLTYIVQEMANGMLIPILEIPSIADSQGARLVNVRAVSRDGDTLYVVLSTSWFAYDKGAGRYEKVAVYSKTGPIYQKAYEFSFNSIGD